MQGKEVKKGQIGGDKIKLPVGQYSVEIDVKPKVIKDIKVEPDKVTWTRIELNPS